MAAVESGRDELPSAWLAAWFLPLLVLSVASCWLGGKLPQPPLQPVSTLHGKVQRTAHPTAPLMFPLPSLPRLCSLHQVHDEEKGFEMELAWICEDSGRQFQRVPQQLAEEAGAWRCCCCNAPIRAAWT